MPWSSQVPRVQLRVCPSRRSPDSRGGVSARGAGGKSVALEALVAPELPVARTLQRNERPTSAAVTVYCASVRPVRSTLSRTHWKAKA